MTMATITSKGQTTIPKDIRDKLDLRPGTKVNFTLLANGTIVIRVKNRSLKDVSGILHRPGRKPIPISEMKYGR